MVWILSTCARFLNDFGAFGLHSEAVPPPQAELGRHGPGWASKDRQAGSPGGSWLAGWLSCVLCVVIVCVRLRVRARLLFVVCCREAGARGRRTLKPREVLRSRGGGL